MKDILDTLSGFLGMVVFMYAYQYAPLLAIGYIGFHIGVVSMRMSRGYFLKAAHPQS